MKKPIQIILAIILTLVGMFSVYEIINKTSNNEITDNEKFKEEYESLNDKINNSNSKAYPNVDIIEKNNIVYSTEDEIVNLIKSGTAVIYLGFPECPWCRNAIPVLLDAMSETSLEKIYYLNVKDIRNIKKLDENSNVVTEKEGTIGYYKILETLGDKADVYKGLNDESIKRIYAPTVIFVRNGKVTSLHTSTLESQKDPYIKLTDEQTSELKEIYLKGIHKVLADLCDESC